MRRFRVKFKVRSEEGRKCSRVSSRGEKRSSHILNIPESVSSNMVDVKTLLKKNRKMIVPGWRLYLLVFKMNDSKWVRHGSIRSWPDSYSVCLSDAPRGRLIDHRPEESELADGLDELVEIDRLDNVGIHTQAVTLDQVLLLPGGGEHDNGDHF